MRGKTVQPLEANANELKFQNSEKVCFSRAPLTISIDRRLRQVNSRRWRGDESKSTEATSEQCVATRKLGAMRLDWFFFSRVRFSIFTNWINLKQNSMVTSKSLSLSSSRFLTILLLRDQAFWREQSENYKEPSLDIGFHCIFGSFRTGCSSTYNYCLIDLDDWWDHRSSNEIPSRTLLLCTYEKRMVRFILNSCLLEQGLIIIDNKRPWNMI